MTAAEAIASLLAQRSPGRTICPSEAARLLVSAGSDWRTEMPAVHEAARGLAAEAAVRLTWRGEETSGADGPYRISRP